MNAKLWVCIIAIVAVAHVAVLCIIDRLQRLGEMPRVVADPNFKTTTIRYQDEQGRDVKVVREFEVNSKLADEETLAKLPPPPVSSAQPAASRQPAAAR